MITDSRGIRSRLCPPFTSTRVIHMTLFFAAPEFPLRPSAFPSPPFFLQAFFLSFSIGYELRGPHKNVL